MRKITVTLAIVVFFSTLFANAPAKLIPALLNASGIKVSALRVDGSMWDGNLQAGHITLQNNDWFIDAVEWRLNPFSLFAGKLCLDIKSLQAHGFSLQGDACFDSNATLVSDTLSLSSQVRNALALAKFPLPVDGLASVSLEALKWSPEGGFEALKGVVDISNYSYQVAGKREVLGDYKMTLNAPNTNELLVSFIPTPALIQLSGEISAELSGAYKADLTFTPQPSASQALIDSLRFVAAPQDDGSYRFNYSGRF